MRLPRATPALTLTLCLVAPAAGAQISAEGETWRLTRDRVDYSVAEWGSGCGPRPESRSNATGREVTIRAVGGDLEISTGGRRQRTDQCWSDNRHTEALAHARVGNTWNVSCGTPVGESLGERGSYTVTLDGDQLSMRGETRYAWTLQGSNCRATATAARSYERVSGAPPATPTPTPTPPPTPTPAPARPVATPTPTPARPATTRCTPGAAVSIVVSPSRRSTTSGGRVCFRARAVDAAGCESSASDVRWTVQRSRGGAEGSMDRGCFVSAGGGVGLFEVTAAAGALSARGEVEVVTQDRYATLIAERLEDPDGGAPEVNSGAQVGGGALAPETRVDRTSWLFYLGGGAAALALILLLSRRRAPPSKPRFDDDDDAPRPRREVMPPQELSEPSSPTQPPPLNPNRRRGEGVASERPAPTSPPAPKHCPYCRKVYQGELAFCPEDGQPLAPGATPPSTSVSPAVVAADGERRCPKCGRSFPAYMDFCGEDGTALPPR